jgi:hypothetical protein
MGSLAAELKSLVDQLEADISTDQGYNWHVVGELRRLRQRAESLFGGGD